MYFRAKCSHESAFDALDSRICILKFMPSRKRCTWVSMKPGVTVRFDKSITFAFGGRPTESPIAAIVSFSTSNSAGPLMESPTPSKSFPQMRTVDSDILINLQFHKRQDDYLMIEARTSNSQPKAADRKREKLANLRQAWLAMSGRCVASD